MEDKTTIRNRLLKNQRRLKGWLADGKIEAYRLYDRDIPQYPFIVDIYKDSAVVYEKGKRLDNNEQELAKAGQHRSDIFEAIQESMGIVSDNIFFKLRERQKGKAQYEAIGAKDAKMVVVENDCRYLVNLSDYLDTGLFLDHRPLRRQMTKQADNKSFLNLFCYTGSFSVAAAVGGAKTVSVDMSKTYLAWAKDNFRRNELDLSGHSFIHSDTFEFLKTNKEHYDIVFCDPPSFSNSKRMEGSFDIQRDHAGLIRLCMDRLKRDGILYFSNNLRKFKLDPSLQESYNVKDIGKKTIPPDFRDQKIHNCFAIRAKKEQ